MGDLKSPRWLYFKAVLFVFLGLSAGVLLVLEHPTLKSTVLLFLTVWSFSRAYYFAFYVLEHYVDPSYKFSGLWSFFRFVLVSRNPVRTSVNGPEH
jgi:hypothetical protein